MRAGGAVWVVCGWRRRLGVCDAGGETDSGHFVSDR